MSRGKLTRLRSIFADKSGRAIISPLDDSLLAGPEAGLLDLSAVFSSIVEGGPNAVMGFRGLFERFPHTGEKCGAILNITASTIRSTHTRKVTVATVEDSVELGALAVGVHVNIGSVYENEMLSILADSVRHARRFGMPVFALMYPRGEVNGKDNNYLDERQSDIVGYTARVAHAVRIGVELGADFIKTTYTGSSDSFSRVIQASAGIPVLIAGGPKKDATQSLQDAKGAIAAGAAGVAFGRNLFSRREPALFLRALKKVVFENEDPVGVVQAIGNSRLE